MSVILKIFDMGVILVDIFNWVVVCCGVGGVGKIIIVVVLVLCVVEYGCIVVVLMIDLVK